MRQELDNVIKLLDTDPYFGIKVLDLTKAPINILTNFSKDQIVKKYGSVDNFFNSLVPNGITKIGILPKKKNGFDSKINKQNWIDHPKHAYFEIQLIPKETHNPMSNAIALNAPQPNIFGLGVVEFANLTADKRDKDRFEIENTYLKAENERLKEQIHEFKDKELKWNNTNLSGEKQTAMFGMFLENLDKVTPILGNIFNKGGSTPGLNMPNDSSEIKQELMQLIYSDTDLTAYILKACFTGLEIDSFANELNALLKQNNLIE